MTAQPGDERETARKLTASLFFTVERPCEERLADLCEAYNRLAGKVEDAWEREQQKDAEIERLREALKPFAREGKKLAHSGGAGYKTGAYDDKRELYSLRIGDVLFAYVAVTDSGSFPESFRNSHPLAEIEQLRHETRLWRKLHDIDPDIPLYLPESVYRDAMDCAWMTVMESREAIPPAYTEFIGKQLMAHLEAAAA